MLEISSLLECIRDDNGSGRVIIRPSVKRLWVEICTHTHERVPVGFVIPHIKTTSK
jgi:hypothetical protein